MLFLLMIFFHPFHIVQGIHAVSSSNCRFLGSQRTNFHNNGGFTFDHPENQLRPGESGRGLYGFLTKTISNGYGLVTLAEFMKHFYTISAAGCTLHGYHISIGPRLWDF